MENLEKLCDLLFEVSNEDRLRILLRLNESPARASELSRDLDLTIQEIGRHITRLTDVGLTQKDVDGFQHATPYCRYLLDLLTGLEFTVQNREYFSSHLLDSIPTDFSSRIGTLSKSRYTDNLFNFLHFFENSIKEASEYIWIQVDQYPLTALSTILEALNRGVNFKIVEPLAGAAGPVLNVDEFEENPLLSRAMRTPQVEQRSLEKISVFQFVSENKGALAFITNEGNFDYKGFIVEDEDGLDWCHDLFQHFWEKAQPRIRIAPQTPTPPVPQAEETHGQVTVVGRDDPLTDVRIVQDAVDNYDEVILRGTFNFGTNYVRVSRSVSIRGEGSEKGPPTVNIYKKGWSFPFGYYDYVFCVNGDDIDVSVENIHFSDFNGIAIYGHDGNSITIKNNRITLDTGIGRGFTWGIHGDVVLGILCQNEFPGGIHIESNHLDFALSHVQGGFIPLRGIESDLNYRPKLNEHEYYITIGIMVHRASAKVEIKYNTIQNFNARGILTLDNLATAEVYIQQNHVETNVYGSFMSYQDRAGYGIIAQSAWNETSPGFYVEMTDNTVNCGKHLWCGISVTGPSGAPVGSKKLIGSVVKDNIIYLRDGLSGINIEMCDEADISGNRISGNAYYGIQINSIPTSGAPDLGSYENRIYDNHMSELYIKEPDEFSDGKIDGEYFTGLNGKSKTAHVWLAHNSNNSVVEIGADEEYIDEGNDNVIEQKSEEE